MKIKQDHPWKPGNRTGGNWRHQHGGQSAVLVSIATGVVRHFIHTALLAHSRAELVYSGHARFRHLATGTFRVAQRLHAAHIPRRRRLRGMTTATMLAPVCCPTDDDFDARLRISIATDVVRFAGVAHRLADALALETRVRCWQQQQPPE